MIWGIIAVALWVVTIVGYVIRNLMIQNEKLTRLIEERDIYINNIDEVIENIEARLREIDLKGTFASDDEVGFFFTSLKQMSQTLNVYKLRKQ
jgi:hypothetical protein